MPRNASGTSTLVAGNPVATNTIIESDWANTTMADLNNEMTDSLSRSGKGGMTAQFRAVNGSAPTPAISFSDFPQSGMYAFSENDIRMSVAGVDRFRWLQANALPQTWDNDGSVWLDVGGGGVIWTQMDVAPATAVISTGYVTLGGQTIAMPANPPTGFSVAFADKADDWDATNYLTITGNGNTFSQDSTGTYILDLKGAFAQFSYLEGQWQIVNFGRLSDAYGFDGNDFERKDQAFGENMLINGGFDIWQRGTIFSAGTPRYTADRWTANTTTRVDRVAFVPDGEGLAWSAQFLMAPGNVFLIRHGIELQSANDNKPAPIKLNTDYTISGWVYMLSADDLDFRAAYADDALNFGNAQDVVAGGTVIASVSAGTWTKFSYTFNSGTVVPLVSNICFALSFSNNVLDNQSYLTGMKLEEGATATPFTRAGNNIAGELAMCQRYYWQGTPQFKDFYYGTTGLAAMTGGKFSFPATMRAAPSMALVTAGSASSCTFEGVFGNIDSLSVRVTVDATGRYRYTEGEYSADAEL